MSTPSAFPASTSPPSPTVAPLPTSAPGTPVVRGPNKRMLGVVAAILLVVLLVLALSTAGVITIFGSSSTPNNASSFSSARSSAQSAASGFAGGPWNLVVSIGVATTSPVPTNASSVTNLTGLTSATSGCNVTLQPGVGTTVTPPAEANVSTGNSPTWLFGFENSTGALLLVLVEVGAASVVASVSGCSSMLALLSGIPANVVDSPVAASTANTNGGYAFLADHPSANATFLLFGGVSVLGLSTGPIWYVEYVDCPFSVGNSANLTGSDFAAEVDASDGSLLHVATTTVSCSGSQAPSA